MAIPPAFEQQGNTKRWPTGTHRRTLSEKRTEVVVKPKQGKGK